MGLFNRESSVWHRAMPDRRARTAAIRQVRQVMGKGARGRLAVILKRFIGMRRYVRSGHRFGDDLLLKIVDGGLELCIFPFESSEPQVVDDDIRIDAMTFDEPFLFGAEDTELRGGGDPVIDEGIVAGKPD